MVQITYLGRLQQGIADRTFNLDKLIHVCIFDVKDTFKRWDALAMETMTGFRGNSLTVLFLANCQPSRLSLHRCCGCYVTSAAFVGFHNVFVAVWDILPSLSLGTEIQTPWSLWEILYTLSMFSTSLGFLTALFLQWRPLTCVKWKLYIGALLKK